MTAASIQAALDDIAAGVPHFHLGQLLRPDEPPAVIWDLKPDMRRALTLALDSDRLDWFGRKGWRPASSEVSPQIGDVTIHALAARGLVVVVARSKFKKHARITERGQWHARTINSAILKRIKESL